MPGSIESLKHQIVAAFADTPYPGDDRIAKCTREQCTECETIRQDLRGQTPRTLSEEVLDRTALPLLFPEAFRFFIPAYMGYAVEHPDSSIASFTIMSLGPDDYDDFWRERFRLFTPAERGAVIAFLECLRGQEVEGDEEDNAKHRARVDVGIRIWKEMAEPCAGGNSAPPCGSA